MGQVRASALQIRLDAHLPRQQLESTLLHEIIEALNHALELKLEHGAIAGLEAGLYQVLTDNGVDLTPLLHSIEHELNGST